MTEHPSIGDAKRIAQRHGLARCIIFFTLADGRPGYASYGKTRALCKSTRKIADVMFIDYEAEHEEP